MKIVTAAVALDVLGEEHRFTTEARADTSPAGGVLNGNLYLVGGGDPVLGTAPYVAAAAAQVTHPQPYVTPLEALADQIVATGVRQITGSVLGDDSRYDAERFVPSWPASYASSREAGPLGALMVNDAAASLDPLRSADDPAVSAAATLTALLRERGVVVAGEAGRAVAPPVAPVVTTIQSRPLGELVGELLTTSDDNTAELLVKEIGAVAGGAGTRAAGLAIMQAKLGEWGVPLEGIFLIDGSGLDRGNRLTCAALQAVLRHVGGTGPVADGLPVAGRTGTLADAFRGNPAEGRLHAKTGTLSEAKALSGFVDAVDGQRHVSFSYIQNSPEAEAAAAPVWDALGRVLTTYPTAPPIDQLDPEAPAPPN
jgi:D-alanyl-D-alanine carboxypeptidase/D-alanyl-D-alanine-endopeptidase (penicillin-binding protein 4)